MSAWFKHLIVDARLTFRIVWEHVLKNERSLLFIGLFVIIISLLQWLFNAEQLRFILFGDSGLSFIEKIDVLIDALLNIFKFADDIVPISMILIALCQAASLTLYFELRRSKKPTTKSSAQLSSLSLGIIGSGCVACGGSIITPLIGAIASNVSVTLAERIGDVLLVLAVVLSYWSLSKIALVYAHEIARKG